MIEIGVAAKPWHPLVKLAVTFAKRRRDGVDLLLRATRQNAADGNRQQQRGDQPPSETAEQSGANLADFAIIPPTRRCRSRPAPHRKIPIAFPFRPDRPFVAAIPERAPSRENPHVLDVAGEELAILVEEIENTFDLAW